MLDVFFTVDVEIWCDGWERIDEKFPSAFQKYVYGPTAQGNFGLPYQLDGLQDHGFTGVFFVEPLFTTRFGIAPLEEILGLISERKQEIQLHLHPEWVDESLEPLLPQVTQKKPNIRDFTLQEQTALIAKAAHLIKQASGKSVSAFRAGSFGFNTDTLQALKQNNIHIDSSYNASTSGGASGLYPEGLLFDTARYGELYEYPMTVFNDGRSLRHAQLTACSFAELEHLLWQALENGYQSFVILSHNFELLNPAKNRPDPVVIKRFKKLCAFLDRNRDSFRVRGFDGIQPRANANQPSLLRSSKRRTLVRLVEQAYRRRYQ